MKPEVEPEPHENKKVVGTCKYANTDFMSLFGPKENELCCTFSIQISLRAFTNNKLKVMPAGNTETFDPEPEEINGPSRSEIRARRRAVRQSKKDRDSRELPQKGGMRSKYAFTVALFNGTYSFYAFCEHSNEPNSNPKSIYRKGRRT